MLGFGTKAPGKSMGFYRLIPFVGLALALGLGACSTVTPGTEPSTTGVAGSSRTNDEGRVTVVATWAGPQNGPAFEVALDTHSVNLDGYDLAAMATLRVDDRPAVAPASWESYGAGHHRGGRLTFPTVDSEGRPVVGPDNREIVLTLRDVAGVPERVFRWTR